MSPWKGKWWGRLTSIGAIARVIVTYHGAISQPRRPVTTCLSRIPIEPSSSVRAELRKCSRPKPLLPFILAALSLLLQEQIFLQHACIIVDQAVPVLATGCRFVWLHSQPECLRRQSIPSAWRCAALLPCASNPTVIPSPAAAQNRATKRFALNPAKSQKRECNVKLATREIMQTHNGNPFATAHTQSRIRSFESRPGPRDTWQ